jgi:REP element-mobilizing transposase RayT
MYYMARPLRIEYAGAVYHVTSRGNGRKPIFKDDEDRVVLFNILGEVNERYHWLCHAYCLMDNHYHLIIETPDGNLSKGMRQLNGIYTMRFNKRHDSVGHVFQGRYKAILLQKESHLLEVCRYVVLNPIRSKAARTPGQWKWSSYRGTAGIEIPLPCLTTDWVLGQFGTKRRVAERKYRAFVRDGIAQETIWSDVKGQSILGDEDFVDRLINYVRGYEEVKEIPRSQRYVNRPTLEEIFKNMKEKRRKRNRRIGSAVERWGYSQREVADYLGLHYSTVSRLIKEVERKMSKFKT